MEPLHRQESIVMDWWRALSQYITILKNLCYSNQELFVERGIQQYELLLFKFSGIQDGDILRKPPKFSYEYSQLHKLGHWHTTWPGPVMGLPALSVE